MKIVLAFDSFKGSLSAAEACQVAAEVLRAQVPSSDVVLKPMADGGEGTAETVRTALGGEWMPVRVMGPLPDMKVDAGFLWFSDERRALVEMATASGLMHLRPEQMNPLRATTYGTGELIAAALKQGARRLWLAVGGSATTDGGVGAAMALGWRFLDERGQTAGLGGGELERICEIIPPARRPSVPVEVLCDVDNPLCGPQGAARTYGPQKGATPEMVEHLDAGLLRLGTLVREQLGADILSLPGAGAAGGLAGGAVAFLNATLASGTEAVMRMIGLEPAMVGADWVITGEGAFDEQSLHGKVVSGVLRLARKFGARVAVIAGSVDLPADRWRAAGVAVVVELRAPGMTVATAMTNARRLLAERTCELVQKHLDGDAALPVGG